MTPSSPVCFPNHLHPNLPKSLGLFWRRTTRTSKAIGVANRPRFRLRRMRTPRRCQTFRDSTFWGWNTPSNWRMSSTSAGVKASATDGRPSDCFALPRLLVSIPHVPFAFPFLCKTLPPHVPLVCLSRPLFIFFIFFSIGSLESGGVLLIHVVCVSSRLPPSDPFMMSFFLRHDEL